MIKNLAAIQKFVSKHRVFIAVGVTLTVVAVIQMRNANTLNDFLKEHGLFDEYYGGE